VNTGVGGWRGTIPLGDLERKCGTAAQRRTAAWERVGEGEAHTQQGLVNLGKTRRLQYALFVGVWGVVIVVCVCVCRCRGCCSLCVCVCVCVCV